MVDILTADDTFTIRTITRSHYNLLYPKLPGRAVNSSEAPQAVKNLYSRFMQLECRITQVLMYNKGE
jgi:hypothetical protein